VLVKEKEDEVMSSDFATDTGTNTPEGVELLQSEVATAGK
jgi:hypothetical protein